MKKHLGILFILCLFWGQSSSENIRFYDSGQLSCNLITKICQDNRGFIWVGTEYGLNKFDGVRFTQYLSRENDSTSLLNNIIRSLYVDRSHRLWIGCSNGLQYYVPERMRSAPFPLTGIYLRASLRFISCVRVKSGYWRPVAESLRWIWRTRESGH